MTGGRVPEHVNMICTNWVLSPGRTWLSRRVYEGGELAWVYGLESHRRFLGVPSATALKVARDSFGSNRMCQFLVKTGCLWHKHLENEIILLGGHHARFFRKLV